MSGKENLSNYSVGILSKDISINKRGKIRRGTSIRYRRHIDYDSNGLPNGKYVWHYLDNNNSFIFESKHLLINSGVDDKTYCTNCSKREFGNKVSPDIDILSKFKEIPINTSLTGFKCSNCGLNYIANINWKLKVRFKGSYSWENYIFE